MKEWHNRAVILMPYFGRLPSCLGTYLASLKGKRFDVLWISDLPVREHPDNFKIFPMTFDECKARIEDRLGAHVCVNGGRRLCDFKPMYGQIFEDLIREYGYWGFGDCDLVYGEAMNGFLQKTIETGMYDAVSMQAEYLSGPTCFLRNNERMRMLYRKARDWESVCSWSGSRILNFDECGGMFFSQLKAGTMTMEDCSRIRDSFAAVIWREPNLKFYHENVIDECNLRNGEVIEMQGGGCLKTVCHWRRIISSWRRSPDGSSFRACHTNASAIIASSQADSITANGRGGHVSPVKFSVAFLSLSSPSLFGLRGGLSVD